jgi:hypothetical protein
MSTIGIQGALPLRMKINTTETLTTITLEGDVTGTAAALQADVEAAIAGAAGKLVIDLSACTGLGVDGLGLVFGAYRSLPWGVELELRATRTFASLLRLCFGRRGKVHGANVVQTADATESGSCRLVFGTPILAPEAIVEVV